MCNRLKKMVTLGSLLGVLISPALFAGHHGHEYKRKVEKNYYTKNYYYTGAPGAYYGGPTPYPAYYYSYPYYDSNPYDNYYSYPSYDTGPRAGLYLQLGR